MSQEGTVTPIPCHHSPSGRKRSCKVATFERLWQESQHRWGQCLIPQALAGFLSHRPLHLLLSWECQSCQSSECVPSRNHPWVQISCKSDTDLQFSGHRLARESCSSQHHCPSFCASCPIPGQFLFVPFQDNPSCPIPGQSLLPHSETIPPVPFQDNSTCPAPGFTPVWISTLQ